MHQNPRLPAEKATDCTGSRGRGKKLRVEVASLLAILATLPLGHGDRTAMQGLEGTAALVSRAENHVGGDRCRRTQ
jgi:hypothetical protein